MNCALFCISVKEIIETSTFFLEAIWLAIPFCLPVIYLLSHLILRKRPKRKSIIAVCIIEIISVIPLLAYVLYYEKLLPGEAGIVSFLLIICPIIFLPLALIYFIILLIYRHKKTEQPEKL